MDNTIHFRVYEEAPGLFMEEVVGPCKHDGSKAIILEFSNDCIGLTREAAEDLTASLINLLAGKRAVIHFSEPVPERPAYQRYGRALLYLGLGVLLGLACYSFFTFAVR